MRVKKNFLRRVVEIGKGRMRRASQRWKKIHQQKKKSTTKNVGGIITIFYSANERRKIIFASNLGISIFQHFRSLLLLLPNTCVMSFYSQFISTGFERFF
jgi:hypothetical protein